jgi:hypothetical protein
MDEKSHTRTDLAEKAFKLLLVGIPLVTAIINLISKVVNYACRVPELRIQLHTGG